MKYMSLAESKRQHQYLGLPGEFQTRLPQEVVFPNMSYGRADEFYLNDENMLIDLEEESNVISPETFKKFAKYLIFGCFMYSDNIYIAVLCHEDPKKEYDYYQYSPSLIIKVHYYYFSQEELWAKYEMAQELKTQSMLIKSKDNEINSLVEKNNQFKSKIDQLKEIGDFDAPESKKIIQSLLLL